MAKNPNSPFPPQKRLSDPVLPQPVKGPLGSVPPPPNPQELAQPGSEGPLGSVPGGPAPKDLLAAKQRASALLAQAARLGHEDSDQLEEEARAAGVSPSQVPDALSWLDQVAQEKPQWLLKALKSLDPGTVSPPEQELSDLFAVWRRYGSHR